MKLDYDCVREVLLTLEEISIIDDDLMFEPLVLDDFTEIISDYSEKEVLYALRKLDEAGFISTCDFNKPQEPFDKMKFIVFDITYSGHEYITSIRDNKIWTQIKEKAPALTFEIIKKIALSLIGFGAI